MAVPRCVHSDSIIRAPSLRNAFRLETNHRSISDIQDTKRSYKGLGCCKNTTDRFHMFVYSAVETRPKRAARHGAVMTAIPTYLAGPKKRIAAAEIADFQQAPNGQRDRKPELPA
jgi:hypothetical protein